MNKEKNRVALVTGGGRRLGRHISLALAEAGYNVVVNYSQSDGAARETVRRIESQSGRAMALEADISDSGAVRKMVDKAVESFGRIHLLVNNAAIFPPSSFEELDETVWDRTMDVNLKGTYLCSKILGDHMRARGDGGRIVNIACLGGFQPWHKHIAYSVSKAGVVMLTRCLAKALAPDILVNAVAPGTIRIADETDHPPHHPMEKQIPMKRYAAPEDIARTVLYFAQGTDYITGQVLLVDGGTSLQSIW